MNIPEFIALQGIEIVNEYRNKQNELSSLEDRIYKVAADIKKVEKALVGHINDPYWNRPHNRYVDWKSRDIVDRAYTLTAITKVHNDLSFKFIDLDNQYGSIKMELFEKGWLTGWMKEECEKEVYINELRRKSDEEFNRWNN